LNRLAWLKNCLNEELEKAKHRIEELTGDAERLLKGNERFQEVVEGHEGQITELVQERNRLREQLQTGIKVGCDHPITQPVQTVRTLSRRERLQRIVIPS
jgi:predicted  nucleic acid-binding Zn-ribbon protein